MVGSLYVTLQYSYNGLTAILSPLERYNPTKNDLNVADTIWHTTCERRTKNFQFTQTTISNNIGDITLPTHVSTYTLRQM